MKIFDNFLNEGITVLYKVALACLQTFEARLLATKTSHYFLATLHDGMLRLNDNLKKHPEEEQKFLQVKWA